MIKENKNIIDIIKNKHKNLNLEDLQEYQEAPTTQKNLINFLSFGEKLNNLLYKNNGEYITIKNIFNNLILQINLFHKTIKNLVLEI